MAGASGAATREWSAVQSEMPEKLCEHLSVQATDPRPEGGAATAAGRMIGP
jgi:hypothetical protein